MFLGIDLGTTAIKIAVMNQTGTQFSLAKELTTYQVGEAVYQKANEVLETLADLINEIPLGLRGQLAKIGVSCAMHSLMPVVAGQYDKIFLWSDQQANQWLTNFRKTNLAQTFYLKTGTPIHPMSTFAKIGALKQQYPEESTQWYGLKELILYELTGHWQIDTATASATGLLNLNDQIWDAEILAFLKLRQSQLAQVVDPKRLQNVTSSCAQNWQIPKDTLIMAGASDGCLAALAGYQASGIPASLTIGTSAAVRKLTKKPQFDWKHQNFCYRLPDDWFVIGAPSNNGGSVLAWLQTFLGLRATDFYPEVARIAQDGQPGAAGLRFFPFIHGERAPYWRTDLQASFQNLTSKHQRPELIRSVLEGLLQNIHSLVQLTGQTEVLASSGGFFQTPELAQLTADVLGCPLALTPENEPVVGLYLLAGGKSKKAEVQMIQPNPQQAAFYQKQLTNYFAEI